MNIYKCTHWYRSGLYGGPFHKKVFYLRADSRFTATIKAAAMTGQKSIEVERWYPPKIETECTYSDVVREYGEKFAREIRHEHVNWDE